MTEAGNWKQEEAERKRSGKREVKTINSFIPADLTPTSLPCSEHVFQVLTYQPGVLLAEVVHSYLYKSLLVFQ